jgi:hypothetical protein
MSEPTTDIGWQIVDAAGNIVDSGPVTFAEITSELIDELNPTLERN